MHECLRNAQRSAKEANEQNSKKEEDTNQLKESVVKVEDHFTGRGQDSETKDRSQESW